MAFIKVQHIIRDGDGNIVSGSAAVADTVYVPGERYHSRQEIRERLGKVVFLSGDKKSGVFMSPVRGLVEYDSRTDVFTPVKEGDPRIGAFGKAYLKPETHTVFGDAYLLLKFMENCGLLPVLRRVFTKKEDLQRLLAHLIHNIARDGAGIACDNFIGKSFASYILDGIPVSSLKEDVAFFDMMGDAGVKTDFFKKFAGKMRKKNPGFGVGCYVDSVSLPYGTDDNPFDALSCGGDPAVPVSKRLALVVDEETGLPLWYDVIPENGLSLNTVMSVFDTAGENTGVAVKSLVLDAGYCSGELLHAFHNGTEKKIICRMPAGKEYPYRTLFDKIRPLIKEGKYAFVNGKNLYFGCKKRIELFDCPIYAYIYIDRQKALRRFGDYLTLNKEEYDLKDDCEKDWISVKSGYFVLLSNLDMTPSDLLGAYSSRTKTESIFKSGSEYSGFLPFSKWTDKTVRGKIFFDAVNEIVLLNIRKKLEGSGISLSEILGKTQSLMCNLDGRGRVHAEMPDEKTLGYYSLMGVLLPSVFGLDGFKDEIINKAET